MAAFNNTVCSFDFGRSGYNGPVDQGRSGYNAPADQGRSGYNAPVNYGRSGYNKGEKDDEEEDKSN